MSQKLKVNDIVKVIAGDFKGQSAKIIQIDREVGRACLEGVGTRERHLRKSYLNPAGGKKTIHQAIALSNLKLETAAKYEKPKESKADKSSKANKASKLSKESKESKASKKSQKGAK